LELWSCGDLGRFGGHGLDRLWEEKPLAVGGSAICFVLADSIREPCGGVQIEYRCVPVNANGWLHVFFDDLLE